MVEKYEPCIILVGEAFGQRQVVKKHSKFYGVIELLAEQKDIQVIYFNDVSCRATVLGKGCGHKKYLVFERAYPDSLSPDTADAKLFIDKYLIEIGEEPMYNKGK